MSWWSNLFLPKPFNQGYLPEKDGHSVFFAEFGNPNGKPLLVFHGGPGGSLSCRKARLFNRKKYHIITFDQRGCGKSLPLGEVRANTTQRLLEDASRLLDFLAVKGKIIVCGGSWGSTLALLWAIQNPQRVEKLLLSQIFLADNEAKQWECSEAAWFYPEFIDDMEGMSGKKDFVSYFNDLINSKQVHKQLSAANVYGAWECVRSSLNPSWGAETEISERELASLRIYMHYAVHDFFLTDQYILENQDKIADIPVLIVHNRLDFVCPLKGAYRLHKALPKSELIVSPGYGHFGGVLSDIISKEFRRFLS